MVDNENCTFVQLLHFITTMCVCEYGESLGVLLSSKFVSVEVGFLLGFRYDLFLEICYADIEQTRLLDLYLANIACIKKTMKD